MNRKTSTIAIILLLAIGVAVYVYTAQDTPAVHVGHNTETTTPIATTTQGVDVEAIERKFITEMIPHHEEAVVAAQKVIDTKSQNPEVLKLANDIVVAQKAEIALMKQWHVEWYGEVYKDNGTYEPMMRNLSNLSGVEHDKAFLEDMITHHLHALAMVQDSARQFKRPELKELSQDIASSQSNEVVAMKILLRQL